MIKMKTKAFSFTYQRPKSFGFDPWVEKIPLEKEMATHSSILAGKIQWTEDPSGHGVPRGPKELDTTEHAHQILRSQGIVSP